MSNSFQFYINSFETNGNDNLTGQFDLSRSAFIQLN